MASRFLYLSKLFFYVFVYFSFTSCNREKDKLVLPPLTDKNVREELLKFGKDNPETMVLISTSLGEIKVKLYSETPLHRANFIRLIKMGYYDKKVFHRVLKGMMVQGGDTREAKMNIGEYRVPTEVNPRFYHKRGALAMARYDDEFNPMKASSADNFYLVQGSPTSQAELAGIAERRHFTYTPEQIKTYLKLGGMPTLDMKYTVFGEVVEGLEIIDKIAAVSVDTQDWPVQDVYITMEVLE